ncbi:MAG: class I SAM-dependent methyltransferase [Candidatus Krumholzibacteriia bacterium]
MTWFETAFGAHYPLLYAHRDAAEADAAVAALERLVPLGPGACLDLGCGTGRHLPFLARGGRPVVGLDLSPALLAAAREAGGGAGTALVRGDMRQLPLRDRQFTAVVSLFTAFGYFGPLAAHAAVVGEIARVLRPDGHWYLDYLNCAAVRRELAAGGSALRRRERGPLIVGEQRAVAGDQVVKRVELRPGPGRAAEASALGVPAAGLVYREEVVLFEPAELDALAAAHGLRRVAAAGGYAGEAFNDPAAPRWLLVYRREVRA